MTNKLSSHTPGPWYFEGERDCLIRSSVTVGAVERPVNPVIARISGDAGLPIPLANARLIAAAPDLKKACEDLINKLYEVAEKYDDRSCDYDVCKEVRNARQIIADIEGEL